MPLPGIVPLLFGAGSAVANMFNSNAQSNVDRAQANANLAAQNKANRDLMQQQNDQNMARWRMENEYNSPSAQMARFKLAGLNPNLIYGQSNTSGGIPAYQSPIQSTDRKAPDIGLQFPNAMAIFQDMELKKAQIDNVKAGTDSTIVKTSNDVLAGKLASNTLFDRGEIVRLGAHKMDWDRLLSKQKTQMNAQSWQYQLEALKNVADRSQLTNDKILEDIIFRRFENQWMGEGVTRSDHPLIRMLTRQLGSPNSTVRTKYRDMMGVLPKFQSSSSKP